MSEKNEFEQSQINTVRQVAKRGLYDRESVFQILDSNLVGNVAIDSPDGPIIIPMLFARDGDDLLFHGSSKSRIMQKICSGDPICISVTTMDGLVLAKSLFHHSMNYRSASVFGSGREISNASDRMSALRVISDKVMPGRWEDARLPNTQEMKATCVAAVKIQTASAKVRDGGPVDDQSDMGLPVWSGVVPYEQVALPPVPAAEEKKDLPIPDYMAHWLNQSARSQHNAVQGKNSAPSVANTILGSVEPYEPRRTKMLDVHQVNGWWLKLYTISLSNHSADPDVVESAIDHIQKNVKWPDRTEGYGFVTLHFGQYIWLLVDLWVDDILRHFIFRSTYENPNDFSDGPDDGTTVCVWELEITKHERDAWVKNVLSTPAQPNFKNYLNESLEIYC